MDTALQEIPKEWLKPHPVLPLPTRQQVLEWSGSDAGRKHLERVLSQRAELMRLEKEDPLRYMFEPQTWKDTRQLIKNLNDEIYTSGANREGKSTFWPKFIIEEMLNRKIEVACFHNTATTSKRQQQRAFFNMLPPEWRARAQTGKRWRKGGGGENVYLNYEPANGFTGDQFILPQTGSICYFFNYGQANSVWEGPEYDIMYFEEGVTLPIIETSRYRRGRERPLLLAINFTPKWGHTPVFANQIAGAEIVQTRPARLLDQDRVHVKGCPPGHMPYIMKGRRKGSAVIFYHNQMNPMGAGKEIAKELVGAPTSRVMIRAYGWADKLATSAFPRFGKAHIITWKRFLELVKRGGTFYCSSDPAGERNWFIQWWFATPEGWHILYREWPDQPRYEEWALSPGEVDDSESGRKNDWRPGPAQRMDAGRSIPSYKALILTHEGWRYDTNKKLWVHDAPHEFGAPGLERIRRRVMDPRFGGTPAPSADEGVTPIDIMGQKGQHDAEGRLMPEMLWEQAPGTGIEESVQLLADDMDWVETEELSVVNCPKFYIVERCEQSIVAFTEFTMAGTLKNALKDPIDAARYYKKSDCRYEAPGAMRVKKGGFW